MADYFKVLIVVPFKHRSNTSRFVLPENLICNFLLELLGAIHVVNWTFRSLRSWRDFARQCFCFGSEAVNASGKAVRGLVKSRVEFPRGFAASVSKQKHSLAKSAGDPRGNMAVLLLASYVG